MERCTDHQAAPKRHSSVDCAMIAHAALTNSQRFDTILPPPGSTEVGLQGPQPVHHLVHCLARQPVRYRADTELDPSGEVEGEIVHDLDLVRM